MLCHSPGDAAGCHLQTELETIEICDDEVTSLEDLFAELLKRTRGQAVSNAARRRFSDGVELRLVSLCTIERLFDVHGTRQKAASTLGDAIVWLR